MVGRRGDEHHGPVSVLTSSLDAVWALRMPLPEKRRLCARIAAAPVLAEAGKGPRGGQGNLCLAVAEAAFDRAAGGLKLATRPLSASRARGWSTRPDPEPVGEVHWATCEDQSTSEGGSTDDRLNSPTVVDDGVLMGEVKQCAEVLDAMGAMSVVGQMVRPELFDFFEEQEGEALGRRVAAWRKGLPQRKQCPTSRRPS